MSCDPRYRRRLSGRLWAERDADRGILRADSPGASLESPVRVIAEPGRYIAAPAAMAVSSVMGRALRDGRWWYYLDDGLYGSYSGQMFDHATYPIEALAAPGNLSLGAGRPDLRQHRCHRRTSIAETRSRAIWSSAG
jgi:diaminopimelate decarboxylase